MGLKLRGDSANNAWGVMDVLAVTDFPDIRLKCLIRSANQGSIIIIPREGGYLVRFYVELGKLKENERVTERDIGVQGLITKANAILHPYSLDVKEVAWWSVYEIGQRLTDRFDNLSANHTYDSIPRVFIAGDACHTHSPKAGQGMNVSMRDSFNLGWKLVCVLRGQCRPAILHTYTDERQKVAKTLIEFDREWSRIIASAVKVPGDGTPASLKPGEFQDYFVQSGRYTAGTAIKYQSSIISSTAFHQALATGFVIGMRFHSAQVIRLADAKLVHLGHTVKADARWRIFLFADSQAFTGAGSRIETLCEHLFNDSDSVLNRFTPTEYDIDSTIDVRAVFQVHFHKLDINTMPALLLPRKGRYRLVDYEKVFCCQPERGIDIFAERGINRELGCMVVVRPDQHVADVLPLDAIDDLTAFFEPFMMQQKREFKR